MTAIDVDMSEVESAPSAAPSVPSAPSAPATVPFVPKAVDLASLPSSYPLDDYGFDGDYLNSLISYYRDNPAVPQPTAPSAAAVVAETPDPRPPAPAPSLASTSLGGSRPPSASNWTATATSSLGSGSGSSGSGPADTIRRVINVNYQFEPSAARLLSSGSSGAGVGPAEGTATKEAARLRQDRLELENQFKMVSDSVNALLKHDALAKSTDSNVLFLKRFARGDFFRTISVEKIFRDQRRTEAVVVESGSSGEVDKRFDFELGSGTDAEKLRAALAQLGKLWAYEAAQWKKVFRDFKSDTLGPATIEEIIAGQERSLASPFSIVEAYLASVKEYVQQTYPESPDPVAIVALIDDSLAILTQEKSLLVQKLAEGALLRDSYGAQSVRIHHLIRSKLK